jgi:hypothetical protein
MFYKEKSGNTYLFSHLKMKVQLDRFQFERRRTLEFFLLALSRACPRADSEAFVYGYGALKL